MYPTALGYSTVSHYQSSSWGTSAETAMGVVGLASVVRVVSTCTGATAVWVIDTPLSCSY